MILRRHILLLLTGLFLMGISEPLKEEKALVSKDVIMPTLLSCLTRQSITIKVPHYREKDFAIVFDELPDLKSEEKKIIDDLKLKEARLRNVEIKVKLDDLSPVSLGEGVREQKLQHFLVNGKNDLHCKIKSFRIKADLKITRKGKDIFGNKRPPIRVTIDRFELKDIESVFSFYLGKRGNNYYAEELALKHIVLSSKAVIKIKELPSIVNEIISEVIGPAISDIGNKEVLNDDFYREFNANLPPRIPESSSPSLPGILQDIFNEERSHILLFWNKLISELC